jgi:hypothetical protein
LLAAGVIKPTAGRGENYSDVILRLAAEGGRTA